MFQYNISARYSIKDFKDGYNNDKFSLLDV